MYSKLNVIGAAIGIAAMGIATPTIAATTMFDGVTIHNVDVLGTIYDVTFHDGAVGELFPDGNFTFNTSTDAFAALNVIIGLDEFKTIKASTPDYYYPFMGAQIPWAADANGLYYIVVSGGGNSDPAMFANAKDVAYPGYTNILFTPSSAVPEPATWGLMIVGFGIVGGGLRRRRRQRVTVTYA